MIAIARGARCVRDMKSISANKSIRLRLRVVCGRLLLTVRACCRGEECRNKTRKKYNQNPVGPGPGLDEADASGSFYTETVVVLQRADSGLRAWIRLKYSGNKYKLSNSRRVHGAMRTMMQENDAGW